MRISKNKPIAVAITLVLLSTMIATATTFTPLERRDCVAFLSVHPDPIGVGQTLLVNAWTSPQPPLGREVGFPEMGMAGLPRDNNTVLFTKPNGDTELVGPMTSGGEGAIWFYYVPDQTGVWTAEFSWAGDEWYFPPTPATTTFTVQQDPVELWLPGVDLPTDYWDRPISAENREWAQISGPWYLGGFLQMFNGSNNPYNRYTTAPKSAHILWKKESRQAGLVGGPVGSLSRASASCSPPIVFMGNLYYGARGGFVCVDLSTGEEKWWAEGGITFLEVRGTTGYLWQIAGSEYRRYSTETGELQTTITGAPSGVQQNIDPENNIIWVFSMPPGYGTRVEPGWLVKWDMTMRGTNWTNGVIWNTTFPEGGGWSLRNYGDVITQFKQGNRQVGINTTTGEVLWAHWRDTPYGAEMAGNGKYYCFYAEEMRWKAFDLDTGNLVWASEQAEYPWGAFVPYIPAVDEDTFYWLSYDGHVYGVNDDDGTIRWSFYSGDTTETPYGTWSFWQGPIVGGGVVFAGTGEHSPTQPVLRGNRLYAIDTEDGNELWSIAGLMAPVALAEGHLVATNSYDGYIYVFNKGQTETTVSASPSVVSKGSTVLIEGTVLDQSPAQPGTPCISDESMSAWMDYLHMQKPCPLDITGVPVTLRAMRSDGSLIELGTATSDQAGHFAKAWTPPDEDVYTITASFEGSESYWMSWSSTGLSVGPEPTPYPEAPTEEDVAEEVVGQLPTYTTMDLILIVAVVIAIIIGIVNFWAIRKRT